MSKSKKFNTEKWADDLVKALGVSANNDQGKTSAELSAITGASIRNVIIRLKELNKAGRLVVGRKRVKTIANVDQAVACYSIKKK